MNQQRQVCSEAGSLSEIFEEFNQGEVEEETDPDPGGDGLITNKDGEKGSILPRSNSRVDIDFNSLQKLSFK